MGKMHHNIETETQNSTKVQQTKSESGLVEARSLKGWGLGGGQGRGCREPGIS